MWHWSKGLHHHAIRRRTAIALLVTAVLGIAGYVVQNKASISANKTQHELIQEAAEREKTESKAGKLLERVHMSQEHFLWPMHQNAVRRSNCTTKGHASLIVTRTR